MRKVIQLMAAFVCPDDFCKLSDHECVKCCYETIKKAFNDLDSGYKELEAEHEFDLDEAANAVGQGGIDVRAVTDMRFYGVSDEEREKIRKVYNITWERPKDGLGEGEKGGRGEEKEEYNILESEVSDMFELWLQTVGVLTLMSLFEQKGKPISQEKAKKMLRPFRKNPEGEQNG